MATPLLALHSAYAPRASAQSSGGEGLPDNTHHAISLTLSSPLISGTGGTLTVTVVASDSDGAGLAYVLLHLPSYFTVTSGSPTTYTIGAAEPPSSLLYDVWWEPTLAVGTAQTFTLTVNPQQPATSAYHDEIAAHVYQFGDDGLTV